MGCAGWRNMGIKKTPACVRSRSGKESSNQSFNLFSIGREFSELVTETGSGCECKALFETLAFRIGAEILGLHIQECTTSGTVFCIGTDHMSATRTNRH